MVLMLDKRNFMKEVILGLGGNEGDVIDTLTKTIVKIEQQLGYVHLKSSLYQTEAWGVENQPDFINMVIAVQSSLSSEDVLSCCLSIEQDLGREREGKEKWHQRVIDVDVLFYEDKVIKTDSLTVPHPFIQERNFVLFPLAEILPNRQHPALKKTFLELKNESKDAQQVILLKYKI